MDSDKSPDTLVQLGSTENFQYKASDSHIVETVEDIVQDGGRKESPKKLAAIYNH